METGKASKFGYRSQKCKIVTHVSFKSPNRYVLGPLSSFGTMMFGKKKR